MAEPSSLGSTLQRMLTRPASRLAVHRRSPQTSRYRGTPSARSIGTGTTPGSCRTPCFLMLSARLRSFSSSNTRRGCAGSGSIASSGMSRNTTPRSTSALPRAFAARALSSNRSAVTVLGAAPALVPLRRSFMGHASCANWAEGLLLPRLRIPGALPLYSLPTPAAALAPAEIARSFWTSRNPNGRRPFGGRTPFPVALQGRRAAAWPGTFEGP